MYYPPGQDPYKSPDINRQDQFFDDLSRAEERVAKTLQADSNKTMTSSYSPQMPSLPGPIVNPAQHSPKKRPVQRSQNKRPARQSRKDALVALVIWATLIDGLLIMANAAPAHQIIGYTVAVVVGLVATFWLLRVVRDLLTAFFVSRAGRIFVVATIGVAALYFMFWPG